MLIVIRNISRLGLGEKKKSFPVALFKKPTASFTAKVRITAGVSVVNTATGTEQQLRALQKLGRSAVGMIRAS